MYWCVKDTAETILNMNFDSRKEPPEVFPINGTQTLGNALAHGRLFVETGFTRIPNHHPAHTPLLANIMYWARVCTR
jgi:hypothetical protein